MVAEENLIFFLFLFFWEGGAFPGSAQKLILGMHTESIPGRLRGTMCGVGSQAWFRYLQG